MKWADLTIAGAFVAGAIAGAVATLRLLRYTLDYLRHERNRDDDVR